MAEVGLNDENRLGIEWTLRTQRDVSINGTPYNVGSVSRVDVGPLAPARRLDRPDARRRRSWPSEGAGHRGP